MINDFIFSLFVNNLLPQKEMKEVESELKESRELGAAYLASIVDYQTNKEYADDILGTIDYDSEKKVNEKARNELDVNSMQVNDNLKKQTNMKKSISKEEALKVQTLSAELSQYCAQNNNRSREESLNAFYRLKLDNVSSEDANAVISSLKKGIITFNSNLSDILNADNFDYKERMTTILKDSNLTNEQKYEALANILAQLKVLSIENYNPEESTFINNFEHFKESIVVLSPEEETSDEQLNQVISDIVTAMENNTLCLAKPETIKEIFNEPGASAANATNLVLNSEDDINTKVQAALVTYILYKKGELPSFNTSEDVECTPEQIGASIAAGIEEAKVISDLAHGRITESKAYQIFKAISGAILFTAIILALVVIGALLVSYGFLQIAAVVSSATLTVLLGMAFGFLVVAPIVVLAGKGCIKLISWLGDALDSVINFIERKVKSKSKESETQAKEDELINEDSIQATETDNTEDSSNATEELPKENIEDIEDIEASETEEEKA